LFVSCPDVLGGIVNDTGAPARSRIEAIRELRQVATAGSGANTPAEDREKFVIQINFGTQKVHREIELKPTKPEQEFLNSWRLRQNTRTTSTNMSAAFNPFERHVSKPEPIQAQPEAESTGEQPTDSKPATEPDSQKAPEDQSSPATPVPPRTARDNKVMNPFASHASEKKPLIRLNRAHEVPPAQRLMAWLPHWRKPTISVRDVRLYGPNSLRNTNIATDAIEVLAGYGWLVPVMAPAYNQKWWEIIRAPEQPVAAP
jgi:hypothetical protein